MTRHRQVESLAGQPPTAVQADRPALTSVPPPRPRRPARVPAGSRHPWGVTPMSVLARTGGKQARSPRRACRSILVAELTPILVTELTWITHERRRR